LSNLLQSSHFGLSNNTLGPLKYTDPTGWCNSGGGSDKAQAINDLASKLSRETMDRFEAQHSQAYIYEMLNLKEDRTKEQLYQNLITEFPSIVLNDNLCYRINVTSYKVYDGLGSRTITTPECSDIRLSTFRYSEIWPTYTRIYEVQYRSTAQSNGGGLPGWMGDANTNLGALGIANDAKTGIIDYAIRTNYKSARTHS
jgi:hypothetical protein